MAKNVFIYPCNSYVGKAVAQSFAAAGHTVGGIAVGDRQVPQCIGTCYHVGEDGAVVALRQQLLTADVVVYDMLGHEAATRDAAVLLAQQPYGGKEVLFLAVSSPLVWAATRPNPDPDAACEPLGGAGEWGAPEAGEGREGTGPGDGHRGSSGDGAEGSGGGGRGSGTGGGSEEWEGFGVPGGGRGGSADMVLPPPPAPTFTQADVPRRVPCPAGRAALAVEQSVLRLGRKGRLRTAVVCPGLLYGDGEEDATFFEAMKAAWSWDAPRVYGRGSNVLPTLHVADLAGYTLALVAALAAPAVVPGPGPSLGATATAASGLALTASAPPAAQAPAAQPTPPAAAEAGAPPSAAPRPSAPAPAGMQSSGRPFTAGGGAGGATAQLSYFLVSDGSRCCQAELVAAISRQLGGGDVSTVPESELHLHAAQPGSATRMMLDFAFESTPLAPPPSALPAASSTLSTTAAAAALGSPPFSPAYAGGLAAHAAAVAAQFLECRRLTPLRVLVTGPPYSGKTHLARRLAHQYGLSYISVPVLLAAAADPAVAAAAGLAAVDPALLRAVQAELGVPASAPGGAREHRDKEREAAAAAAGPPRVSARTLGQLLAAALGEPRAAARCRGFVLDGFPRTAGQARAAFFSAVPLPGVPPEPEPSLAKPAHGKGAKAGKDTAASVAAAATAAHPVPAPGSAAAADTFDVPPGMSLTPQPLTTPTHVIELEAGEEELHNRMAAIEAVEAAETARLLQQLQAEHSAMSDLSTAPDKKPAPAKRPAGRGGTKDGSADPALPPGAGGPSHHTEAGFARRVAAYGAWRQEDAEDLAARTAAAQSEWAAEQARREAERARAEAEASTFKAKRRAARAAAAAAAGGAGAGAAGGEGTRSPSPDRAASPFRGAGVGWDAEQTGPLMGSTMGGGEAAAGGAAAGAAAGPKLPQHGGLVGLCVDNGAVHIRLPNPADEAATPVIQPPQPRGATPGPGVIPSSAFPPTAAPVAAAVAAAAAAVMSPAPPPPLPALEAAVTAFLGAPHNFDGFPQPVHHPHNNAHRASERSEASDGGSAPDPARCGSATGASGAASERLAAAAAAARQGGEEAAALRLGGASEAQRRALMGSVMPVITAALSEVALQLGKRHSGREAAQGGGAGAGADGAGVQQRREALLAVARALATAADAEEAGFVDPYTHASYGIQLAKIEAKAAREAARAAAAAAKAEREAAARHSAE